MSEVESVLPAGIVRLRRHLQAHVIESEGAFLISERGSTIMEGPLAAAVVSRLDGSRTSNDIVTELAGEYPKDWIGQALAQLLAAGLAVTEDVGYADILREDAAFYEMAGVTRADAAGRLERSVVAVRCVGNVDGVEVIEHLKAGGAGTVVAQTDTAEMAADVTLCVVLTDDYLRPQLEAVNRAALSLGRPWMLARPVGATLWIGPLFQPGVTACWSCLTQRIAANLESYTYLQRRIGPSEMPSLANVRLRVGSAIGAGLVALAALRTTAGIAETETSLMTTDLLTGESRRHPVVRRPQCPVCGDGNLMSRRALDPVRFSPRPKTSTWDGGHRAIETDAMLQRLTRHVSPITGVVKSLEPISVGGSPLHVFTAGQNLGRRPTDIRALRRGLRALSCGKGISEAQARASAAGEAIERSSGVFQGDECMRRATRAEIGDAAIHPNECMLFSERQYRHRDFWNLGDSGFNFVFEHFAEDERIDWSPVWSVTNQSLRWLPTQYLYYGYAGDDAKTFAHADSNGCAAGTSLEDAAVQGFCELVERDSVALWWYNRVRRPGIDLHSFGEPYFERLCEIYAGFGREVWALDLTSDLGIPAVGAFSRVASAEREDILIAFGAHLDPRVAVARALTEMNQFITAVLPGADRAGGSLPDSAFAHWCRTATLANQPYLAPDPETPLRKASSWPSQAHGDLAADLLRCQTIAESANLELLVLDQTRPDVDVPVVKVIVPGMRHFWPRLAPGRLYDVPVRLGWCARPTEEPDLNPIAVFI